LAARTLFENYNTSHNAKKKKLKCVLTRTWRQMTTYSLV